MSSVFNGTDLRPLVAAVVVFSWVLGPSFVAWILDRSKIPRRVTRLASLGAILAFCAMALTQSALPGLLCAVVTGAVSSAAALEGGLVSLPDSGIGRSRGDVLRYMSSQLSAAFLLAFAFLLLAF